MSEARSIINPETDRNLLIGIFCGLIGYTALPIGDGMAKIIGMDGYSGLQIAWGRYVFHVLALLPFALIKFSPRELIPKRPLFQTFRASFIIACTFLFFTSLKEVPLADALALIFVAPLVVTGLSGPILGEKVGLHRWMAVFFGTHRIRRPPSPMLETYASPISTATATTSWCSYHRGVYGSTMPQPTASSSSWRFRRSSRSTARPRGTWNSSRRYSMTFQ